MNLATIQMKSSCVECLLERLIDYAGLFPPASLAMRPALENYGAYLRSEWNWILGRFIVSASRLGEFEDAFSTVPAAPGAPPENWRLSVLLGDDRAGDLASVGEFNTRMAGSGAGRNAVVESVEVKVASADEIARLARSIPPELTAYFEIPASSYGECIAALAGCDRRAKIRTGGETADKFPAPESVIDFIRLCAAARVPFKATAGLHHPVRSEHRLTYQSDSPSGMMHGFLNVFLAAAFLRGGMEPELARELLTEQSPQAFHFDRDRIAWRQHRLSQSEIAAARQSFAISFGSCSFTEPVGDLRSLKLL